MVLTGSFSSTTTAYSRANRDAVLAQKSWRRRRSRARTLARACRVLWRFAEPLAARDSLRCNRTARRCSPAGGEHLVEKVAGAGGHRHYDTTVQPHGTPG